MVASRSDREPDGDGRTRWEGYSDYETVSKSVAQSISDAVDAYAWLQGRQQEDASVNPEQAADARADILGAALKLYVEMQQEHERGNDEYDAMLERWGYETDNDGVDEERGPYVQEFHELRLTDKVPGWLFQFVMDIRTAGWKLGYLQAGRRERLPDEDPVQAEAQHMLKGR